jgi:predicted transcriptional regulator
MRRSKLEMSVDILKILAQKGPLKLTHIMYKTNVNCDVLNKNLAFLMKQGLIEVRNVGRSRHVYAITALGLTLLKSWREVKHLLPAIVGKKDVLPLFYRNAVTVKA